MYSPKPTVFYVNEGSYTEENAVEEIPVISEYEKYCQMFSAELLKKVNDREKIANKTDSLTRTSTDNQYPTAKAVYEEFQKFNTVITLDKRNFINGAFVEKVGISNNGSWIITPDSVRVSAGDRIIIKPGEGFRVWLRVFDTPDLVNAIQLKNVGIFTHETEYVSEFEGCFNIQIARTDSSAITPEDYGCSITVVSSRIGSVEREVKELDEKSPEVIEIVDLDEAHTNKQVYGASAMDEVFALWGEALEEKQDKIKDKVYEKIATVIVTPDSDGGLPSKISITEDANGNPFELTDIYCEMNIGLTDGSNGRLRIKAGGAYLLGNFNVGLTNALREWWFRYDSYGEGLGGLCIAPNNSIASGDYPNGNVYYSYAQPVPVGNTININQVTLDVIVGATKTFVAGSKITLWGVRK